MRVSMFFAQPADERHDPPYFFRCQREDRAAGIEALFVREHAQLGQLRDQCSHVFNANIISRGDEHALRCMIDFKRDRHRSLLR